MSWIEDFIRGDFETVGCKGEKKQNDNSFPQSGMDSKKVKSKKKVSGFHRKLFNQKI